MNLARIAALALALPLSAAADPPPFAEWGAETLAAIQRDLWLPERHLYAEQLRAGPAKEPQPSFMWGVGVQLSALAAAARLQPDAYLARTRDYADAIQIYWLDHDGIAGFDVQPGPKPSDRYFDDNAWLAIALAEVSELTKGEKYRAQAAATFRFVVSCEDEKLGGGLYWREKHLTSKNTCTNAPAIVSALRLRQLTGEEGFLTTAKRLHAWTNSRLQDTDGLFWDHIDLEGKVDRRKFSYNSALMIRANCLLHEITGEASYLAEAKRIATAAEKMWVAETGAMSDSGRFAHLLLESFLAVQRQDHDPRWLETVGRSLVFVHENLRNAEGRYPRRWDGRGRRSGSDGALLDQASPARAYWLAADAIGKP